MQEKKLRERKYISVSVKIKVLLLPDKVEWQGHYSKAIKHNLSFKGVYISYEVTRTDWIVEITYFS